MLESHHLVDTIVETVAEYEQVQPEDLPPLADSVDSTTYTKLTTTWEDQTDPIQFTYLWYDVTVSPNGEVTVTP